MKQYRIGMYEKAVPEVYSVPEMMLIGKAAGYDFFEISIDRTDKRINRLYDRQFQEELLVAMHETSFPIGSMCLSALGTYTLGNNDVKNEERAIDIFKHAIDFAVRLGLRIVQIPACDVPKGSNHTGETDRSFFQNLRVMVDYAAAHSVLIGLENMEDRYMDSVQKSMRLIKEINSPYFQLYSDAGNITSASKLYGTDPIKDMELGKDHYIAFHLKETRPNKYGGLFYGDGHVDFPNMVREAWKLGIRRYVLEYWYTGNPNWKSDLIKARTMCEEWIQKSV